MVFRPAFAPIDLLADIVSASFLPRECCSFVQYRDTISQFEVSKRTMEDGSFSRWLSPDKFDSAVPAPEWVSITSVYLFAPVSISKRE